MKKTCQHSIFKVISFLFITFSVVAQDARFSQYYAAPTYLNPALSGAYDGRYRVSAVYRDQWRNSLDNPYVTYTFSGDVRYEIGGQNSRNLDAASGGILFLRDQVDVIDFSTTFISLVGAYHKNLNAESKSYLSAGFRVGLNQKNINYENLSFFDQFNGVGIFDRPTAEILPRNSLANLDVAVGLHFTTRPTKESQFSIGASVDHLTESDVSFYREGNPNNPLEIFPQNYLPRRISADMTYLFPIVSGKVYLRPRLFYNMQEKLMEGFGGASIKVKMGDYGDRNVVIGGFLRANNYIDEIRPTALVGLFGVDIGTLKMGFSYDVNMDQSDFGRRNAFELSIIYIGDYEDEGNYCPTF